LRNQNLSGLLDNRGKKRKGKSLIPEVIWQGFLSFYLDENRQPIKKCLEYTYNVGTAGTSGAGGGHTLLHDFYPAT